MKYRLAAIALTVFMGYLGIINGHLALFENNRPVQVFPYAVQNYSYADQQALKHGIPYSTPQEKLRILEDYLS